MKHSKIRITATAILAFLLWCAPGWSGCSQTSAVPEPTESPSTMETAQGLIEDGNLEQAAQLWSDALDEDPENAQAHYQLGLIQSITAPEQASENLSKAAELDLSLDRQASRVQDALRQGQVVDDTAYQVTLAGQALLSLEEWPLALAALSRAVIADPNYAEAWAYLGEARQHAGQEDPLDALQTAISLAPESYAANLLMSIYWKRNAQPNRALPYLQTAVKLDPNNQTLQEDLAHTLVQAGLVELGFDTLITLTDQFPERADAWIRLARLSIENSVQVEEVGLPAARQAVLLDPENAEATLLLGQAYLQSEQTILAERFFFKSIQQDPAMPDPHLYLAIIYLNQQNPQPAETHLREALSLAEELGQESTAAQARQLLQTYFP